MMCVKAQKTIKCFLKSHVVICVLLTIVPSILAVSTDNVLKGDENGYIRSRLIHKRSISKLDFKRSGTKHRPVRSPQGANPQEALQDGPMMNLPQLDNNRQFDIQPTMTTDQPSVNPQNPGAPEQPPQNPEQGQQYPGQHQNFGNQYYPDQPPPQYPGQGPHPYPKAEHHLEGAEGPESLAEQRDDELEEMLDMLRLRGYTHSVLPANMSMYPDIMNYTEAGEEQEEAEGGEQEEQEGAEEYEADEYPMMTMLPNGTSYQEMEEYEADEGLKPSTEQLPPHKVHNMKQMLSSTYDPYYNYGYQYRPKEGEPHEQIQPTQVVLTSTKESPMNAEQKPDTGRQVEQGGQAGNGTAGSPAKMVDVKKITHEKMADFGGLSASATFGIVIGTIVGFWLVMGPLICLLMKVREHHKEKEKRFLIGPRSQSEKKSDSGIMEAMIMTELGKLPFRKRGFKEFPKPSRAQERMSLTDDKDETYHDAFDTPVLLP